VANQGNPDTREAFLESAMLVLAGSFREHLRRVLTTGAVAEAAGLHRQTFYLYWDTQAEFIEDFVDYVTDPAASTSSARLASIDDDLDDAGDDPAAEVRRMSERTFRSWIEDPVHFSRMVLWATHNDDDYVLQRMRALYRANNEAAAAGFGAIGDAWGIEPKPPFTLESIAALFNALRDGLLLHLLISGDDLPPSFFGDVHLALSGAVTRRVGEETLSPDDSYRAHVRGPVDDD
jgi:AcrR family transcriptional regulator